MIAWGASNGPATGQLIEGLLRRLPHPEQSYRACLGLLALRRRYDAVRLEAACARAVAAGTIAYRSVKSILAANLDTDPLESHAITTRLPASHEHIRGPRYYDTPPTDLFADDRPLVRSRPESLC
ncbi:hypothetical protein [Gemmatimonas sp.]|uniref:hypothetical protein n=1 Tax=Gemmatimonas sp. TaxID=1962908 RepID=UPI00286E9E94|nr:hypothetical protein [Gemmatimonas sp.]